MESFFSARLLVFLKLPISSINTVAHINNVCEAKYESDWLDIYSIND